MSHVELFCMLPMFQISHCLHRPSANPLTNYQHQPLKHPYQSTTSHSLQFETPLFSIQLSNLKTPAPVICLLWFIIYASGLNSQLELSITSSSHQWCFWKHSARQAMLMAPASHCGLKSNDLGTGHPSLRGLNSMGTGNCKLWEEMLVSQLASSKLLKTA